MKSRAVPILYPMRNSAGGQTSWTFFAPSIRAVFAGSVMSCDNLMTTPQESSTSSARHLQTGENLTTDRSITSRVSFASISRRLIWSWTMFRCSPQDRERWRNIVTLSWAPRLYGMRFNISISSTLNKGFGSEFIESHADLEEGRRAKRTNSCDNKNKDDDITPM